MFVACQCKKEGTEDLLNVCDKTTGDCRCKPNIMGAKCDICKDGYYEYPTDKLFINAVSIINVLMFL